MRSDDFTARKDDDDGKLYINLLAFQQSQACVDKAERHAALPIKPEQLRGTLAYWTQRLAQALARNCENGQVDVGAAGTGLYNREARGRFQDLTRGLGVGASSGGNANFAPPPLKDIPLTETWGRLGVAVDPADLVPPSNSQQSPQLQSQPQPSVEMDATVLTTDGWNIIVNEAPRTPAPVVMQSDEWECPSCTVINPSGAILCEVCETHRPQQQHGWLCSACTFFNTAMHATVCEVCGGSRDVPT